jgi:23S rRNA A2030 N6-methylase RlmJ
MVANRHYAKIADVWKHLPLAELLTLERPARYLESHAGSALYPFTSTPERDYGVRWFLDHADASLGIGRSAYRQVLTALPAEGGYPVRYPGSAMQPMLLLGRAAEYVLCDTDPESVASLREAAVRTGLIGQTRIVEGDGRAAVWNEASKVQDLRTWAVHIDPFDAFGAGPAGAPSAVELARRLAEMGALLSYWYGYEDGSRELWAWDEIAQRGRLKARSLWCGDIRLAEPETDSGIVGCGVFVANATEESTRRCEQLGQELEGIYRNARLPSGRSGSIRFRSVQTPGIKDLSTEQPIDLN